MRLNIMSQYSAIEWTDHTFNPWWGCIKVSPGCTHCYAESWARRYGHDIWGLHKSRRFFGENHWSEPLKWNKQAKNNNRRYRIFCASMADVFEDNSILDSERAKLWNLIERTPMLDWLLLTKRPENMIKLAPWGNKWPRNVWAMTTVENQEYAEKRLPYLVDVPAIIRGISVEPMLGPVDLTPWISQIDWVIAGGESGAKSRPMNPQWVRSVRDQCLIENKAFFFKQWGNWVPSIEEFQPDVETISNVDQEVKMKRLGKKAAGKELDGLVWNQVPYKNVSAIANGNNV